MLTADARTPGSSRGAVLALAAAAALLAPWRASGTAMDCGSCHAVTVTGSHARLACVECHGRAAGPGMMAGPDAPGCTSCHPGRAAVLRGAMATRAAERAFADQAFGRFDPGFFEKTCTGCHVAGCDDCHGKAGHALARPSEDACHACHRGYFVGAEYQGRAPREDSVRYQRGPAVDGERYLKMRPDVHAEAGLACGDCHSMASLAAGERTAKTCRDCHRPAPDVLEHRIAGHLEAMTCSACHSAWAAQEYGTFFVRVGQGELGDLFRVKREPGSEYVRSAYLRRQDAPPLGVRADGKVSPIRPQLIAYYGDLRGGSGRPENVLVAARWKPFFPHTVRRGAVLCEGCHADPRRFLLEPEAARIHRLAEDGMTLRSFWNQQGQTVEGGRFLSPSELQRLESRSPAYRRASVEKWKSLVDRVDPSSGR